MTHETSSPAALATLLASIGVGEDTAFGAVSPPLVASTTYVWPNPAEKPAFDYGRGANPTRALLQRALTALDGAADCVVTASGMAAVDLVLSIVRPGERVIAPFDCYGGTHRLLCARARRGHFTVDFIDETDREAVQTALAAPAKLVWIETPSNPVMRIADIAEIVRLAKAAGALTAADNTFLTPLHQRPLDLGADLVVHSTTKFLNGHSDVVGGAVLARDHSLMEDLGWWANAAGLTGGAFDCHQTLRGLRTLAVRLEAQTRTAAVLAQRLADTPHVHAVHYPGLPSHPAHALAARQQSGFGALLSFELADGAAAERTLRALNLITVAASLGGFETLACRPASMTHAGMDPSARAAAGVHEGLLRLSVGLEAVEDLWRDLEHALAAAAAQG